MTVISLLPLESCSRYEAVLLSPPQSAPSPPARVITLSSHQSEGIRRLLRYQWECRWNRLRMRYYVSLKWCRQGSCLVKAQLKSVMMMISLTTLSLIDVKVIELLLGDCGSAERNAKPRGKTMWLISWMIRQEEHMRRSICNTSRLVRYAQAILCELFQTALLFHDFLIYTCLCIKYGMMCRDQYGPVHFHNQWIILIPICHQTGNSHLTIWRMAWIWH